MTSTTVSRNIVVGIDGSDASLAALRYAIREGIVRSAPVEVVHAWHAHTARDVAFAAPHELQRGSICMLQIEVAALVGDVVSWLRKKAACAVVDVDGRRAV